MLDQQGIDLFLRYRMMTWGFTDINNQTACRSLSQKLRVNQAIVDNHLRVADTVQTFYRYQRRIARPCPYKPNLPFTHRYILRLNIQRRKKTGN
jgi:hypothetical protein